jgi:hypothetical protein
MIFRTNSFETYSGSLLLRASMRPRFTDVLVLDFANCNTRRRLFTVFNCDGLFKRFSQLFRRASVSEARPNTALRRGCGDPVRGHLVFSAVGSMMAYLEAGERKAPHSSSERRLAIER